MADRKQCDCPDGRCFHPGTKICRDPWGAGGQIYSPDSRDGTFDWPTKAVAAAVLVISASIIWWVI